MHYYQIQFQISSPFSVIVFFDIPVVLLFGKGHQIPYFDMKQFTSAFLVISILFSVNVYSQLVTLDKRDTDLESILKEINKQTGYSYSVRNESLQKAKRFDLHVKDLSVEKVLDIALKDQLLTYSIGNKIIIIKNIKIDVKGKVVDENNVPVIAMVQEKGGSYRVSTDANGNFLIKYVSANTVLQVSGLNIMPIEIAVNGRTDLPKIIVKPSIKTEELIMPFEDYEYHKVGDSSNRFTVIDKTLLNEQFTPNILDRLNCSMGRELFIKRKPNNEISLQTWHCLSSLNPFVGDSHKFDGKKSLPCEVSFIRVKAKKKARK